MILFAPTAHVSWWTHELSGILLNASMWSNKTKVAVIVHDVRETPHDHNERDRYGYTVRLAVENDKPADRASLAEYLYNALPSGFDCIDRGSRVDVMQSHSWRDGRSPRR